MMTTQKTLNVHERDTSRAKLRKQLFGAVTYFLVIMAIGASLTLFAVSGKLDEDETLLVIVSSLLYGTAVIAMIWIMIYTSQNKYASLEAMEVFVFNGSKIKFSARGDPIHMLLRFGLCLFACMSVSYCVAHCYEMTVERKVTAGNVILHTFFVFFLIIQACFILFLHKFIIFTYSRRFKYLFMHLAAVNLCALVQISSMNVLVYRNADDWQYQSEWSFTSSSVLQYLSPAVTEFCTIAAVILFEMARCSGHMEKVKPRIYVVKPRLVSKRIWKIVGWTLAACTFIFMVALEIIGYRLGSVRHILHLAEVGLFTLLALTLVGFSLHLVRRLKFTMRYSTKQVEEVLLIVTAGPAIVYFVACLFLAAGHICKDSAKSVLDMHLLRFQIALSILQLIHVLVQTYLLQDNLYRCCEDESSIANRPGRPFLVLLTFVNISLWVIHSFQVTKNDQLHKYSKYNSTMDNMGAIFTTVQLTMPMVMLYYFISAVCIRVAIKHAYMKEDVRFVRRELWRNVNTSIDVYGHLEENAKPFVTDYTQRDTLAHENSASALFQDLPAQSISRRQPDERFPTPMGFSFDKPKSPDKPTVENEKSDIRGIQMTTENNSSADTVHTIDKETASGRMGDHQPFDSPEGLWNQQYDYTSNLGMINEELNEPSINEEDNDELAWQPPLTINRPLPMYEQEGFDDYEAEDNVQPTLHDRNESRQSMTTNPFLESLDGRNVVTTGMESETSDLQHQVDVNSGVSFADDLKNIHSEPESPTNIEGDDEDDWDQANAQRSPTDYELQTHFEDFNQSDPGVPSEE